MESKSLNGAVAQIVVAVVIATVLSGFSTYVAINAKLTLLEYKMDEYMQETQRLRREVSNLQLQRGAVKENN